MTQTVHTTIATAAPPPETDAPLGPDDPDPVGVYAGRTAPQILIICDHAGNLLPPALAGLGVEARHLNDHIAWDPGALGVARGLAEQLGATLVFGRYSRLAADLNREPADASAVPVISDGVLVPGNIGISAADRARRIEALHDPYHQYIADYVSAAISQGVRPAVISIHSFTPVVSRINRPWEAGVLWDKDPRIAIPLLAGLRSEGVFVGDNEPYSGRHTADYSLDRHAEGNHLAHAAIELRQDHVMSAGSQHIWAERLAGILKPILADESLHELPVETDVEE